MYHILKCSLNTCSILLNFGAVDLRTSIYCYMYYGWITAYHSHHFFVLKNLLSLSEEETSKIGQQTLLPVHICINRSFLAWLEYILASSRTVVTYWKAHFNI